jgi:hypothetical protein
MTPRLRVQRHFQRFCRAQPLIFWMILHNVAQATCFFMAIWESACIALLIGAR